MSNNTHPSSTDQHRAWERRRPARNAADAPHAGETPALAGAIRLTLGTNNVYALPGDDGVTLIDAGPDYEGAWQELHAQLRAHNLDPASVHTILLTHHHLDHAGLAARWQAAGARILIGAADAPALAMDTAAREHERTLARQELLRHGVPPDALSSRPTAGAGGSGGKAPDRRGLGDRTGPPIPEQRYTRWAAPLHMTAIDADGLLEDGDRIDDQPPAARHTPTLERSERAHPAHRALSAAKDRTPHVPACIGPAHRLQVIAAPGHTPGTLLFLDFATGALFTGDHVLPRMAPTSGIQFAGPGEPSTSLTTGSGRSQPAPSAGPASDRPPFPTPLRTETPHPAPSTPAAGARRVPSLPAYLASLRATRSFAPRTAIAYPGHGEPFTDLAEAVNWTVRLLEQRARRALTQLRRGPATAYTLAQRMFPHLRPRHLRPTLAEVIGLLDLLAERGLARADEDGTLVTWHALAPERSEGTAIDSDPPQSVP